MNPQCGYIRPPDAATFLGISERHLRTLQRKGALPAYRLGRKCTVYRVEDLHKAMSRFRVKAVGE